ncbi:hypothetical protein NMY22_g3102 [Coprinellus aureogranulatus]|nr:hypothetical protein NMY22_g3102 [Coprinellus aureogranulatus]
MAEQKSESFSLLDLPQELIDKIVQGYVADDYICGLRLVCRALNDVASRRALEIASLGVGGGCLDFNVRAKALIALGPSAFEACTSRLVLYPDGNSVSYEGFEDLFVGVLGKLRAVETLDVGFIEECNLTVRMVQAMGQLPRLIHLSLFNVRWQQLDAPLIAPSLANSVNLRSLLFEWHTPFRVIDSGSPVVSQARALISSCPNLEVVNVGRQCAECADRAALSDILRGTPVDLLLPEEFRPSVKTFTVLRSLQLSASCPLTMRYLANLTTFTISNAQPEHQELWAAFSQSEIRLVNLTVFVATEPLLEYLLGYRGLKSFCAGQFEDLSMFNLRTIPSEAVPNNNTPTKRVLYEGLSHHRDTLEKVWLLPLVSRDRTDPVGAEPWGTDEDHLHWLQQFRQLRNLGLLMFVDGDKVPLHLEQILELLTSHLRSVREMKLQFLPSPKVREDSAKPSGTPEWVDEADANITSAVLRFQLSLRSLHCSWLEVSLKIVDLGESGGEFWIERSDVSGEYHFRTNPSTMKVYEGLLALLEQKRAYHLQTNGSSRSIYGMTLILFEFRIPEKRRWACVAKRILDRSHLPNELIHEIVVTHATWSSQLNLRGVCRALNEVTTREALRTMVLRSGFCDRARALLDLGPSALAVHTTRLYLHPYAQTDEELEELCVGVLGMLQNVEILEFRLEEEHQLTARMVQALGQLPHLRDLTLLNMRIHHLTAPFIALSLVSPAKLQSLTLEWHPPERLSQSGGGGDSSRMRPKRSRVRFSNFLKATPVAFLPKGMFKPTLKTLTVLRSLKLSASCPLTMRYLANLTSLTISNGKPEHQALWPAFLKHGIYLTDLTVCVPSESLVGYLLGYQGLISFRGGQFEKLRQFAVGGSANETLGDYEAAARRVICVGLHHHRYTLEEIWLVPLMSDHTRPDPVGAELWAMADEGRISCLKEFQRLKRLGVVILLDWDMTSLYFESTIRLVMAHLHSVKVLKLNILPSPEVRSCIGQIGTGWFREADLDTISALLDFRIAGQELHHSRTELILNVGYLDKQPGNWDHWWIERDKAGDLYRFRNEESTDPDPISMDMLKFDIRRLERRRLQGTDAGTLVKKNAMERNS